MAGSPPVIVIGGGPVGLTLSLILARHGVRTIVLEARDAPTPLDESRAITWMPRGLELLDWLGVYDSFAKKAVSRVRHEFWSEGHPSLRVPIEAVYSPHPHTLDLPQHWSETLIEEAARKTGLVEARRGCKVVSAVPSFTEATVQVEAPDGSRTEHKAQWSAICDGYRSNTRDALGIATTRRDYGADAVVADFQIAQDLLLPGTSKIEMNPARPVGLFRFGPDRWRVIYRINHGEDRDEMAGEPMARRILAHIAPQARAGRFLWASAFRLAQQQSGNYRHGRFILVGDAAHGMRPSAGAGLQVGVLGAWRLGWRLALAAQGHQLADVLIDNYAREQRVASDQVQLENMLIFRNMAVRPAALAKVRTALFSVADTFPGIARSIARSLTLVEQHVPTSKAADRPSALLRSASEKVIRSFGDWRAGYRMPRSVLITQPSGLEFDGRQHLVIPISGSLQQRGELARRIVDRMPVPARIIGATASNTGRPIVAVVRPDQEVAVLISSRVE